MAQASKAKQGMYSLLPMHRQLFSISRKVGPHPSEEHDEDEPHHSEYLPFLLLLLTLYAERDITWSGLSLWSIEVTCPGCVCSQPPKHPQSPHQ